VTYGKKPLVAIDNITCASLTGYVCTPLFFLKYWRYINHLLIYTYCFYRVVDLVVKTRQLCASVLYSNFFMRRTLVAGRMSSLIFV